MRRPPSVHARVSPTPRTPFKANKASPLTTIPASRRPGVGTSENASNIDRSAEGGGFEPSTQSVSNASGHGCRAASVEAAIVSGRMRANKRHCGRAYWRSRRYFCIGCTLRLYHSGRADTMKPWFSPSRGHPAAGLRRAHTIVPFSADEGYVCDVDDRTVAREVRQRLPVNRVERVGELNGVAVAVPALEPALELSAIHRGIDDGNRQGSGAGE